MYKRIPTVGLASEALAPFSPNLVEDMFLGV
jgi:hypothetical protein